MRSFHRVLATTVASLAFAAAGLAGAAPALASPEDGEGCVGTPAVPASYICVISLTPENALPGTTTTTIPVTVPELCYFLDCTEETTVDIPVPGVSPSEGVVAVLWYQGEYIPIAVGTGQATTLVNDTVDLAVGVAQDALAAVDEIRDGLPTTGELVQMVQDVVDELPSVSEIRALLQPWIDFVTETVFDLLGPISCNIDPVC